MSRDRLIVLKFGGSVLKDESTLRLAVHEIYRWRRAGWRVAAVVSALAGRTDELLRAAERTSAGADAHAVAALVATGELHSAALLGLHLDRAGVRASVIWPMSLDLIAEGPALDASPVSLCVGTLSKGLARHGVVVIPGYAAHDLEGRPVVLGRGGSDLSALFIAHALGADRCRLIKDVDGLYDRDPARGSAKLYAAATFADALATDGSILQHKALRFGQRHGLVFELGRINSVRPTRIGAAMSRFAQANRPRRLRVALLGLGTVGGGVFELLRQMPEQFEVTAIAVRDAERPRPGFVEPPALTEDAVAAASGGAEIVVEAIGGCGVALRAVTAAIASGAHVVTANKSLIAARGGELWNVARQRAATVRERSATGPQLRYSAAVGGSMPVLERIAALGRGRVASVRAVINGTTNFILDCVEGGMRFDKALRLARENGYAEQDPSRDLDGTDAAEKLCIIARALGYALTPAQVECDVISEHSIAQASKSRSPQGGPLRHVATLTLHEGQVRGEVRLLQVANDDPLAGASGAGNVAVIELGSGQSEVLEGKGAGRWPTAEAVVADLLAIARKANAFNDSAEPVAPEQPGAPRNYFIRINRQILPFTIEDGKITEFAAPEAS